MEWAFHGRCFNHIRACLYSLLGQAHFFWEASMKAPGRYDLHIQRGEDFLFTFTIEIDGVVLDLTDATVVAQIRDQDLRDGTLIADFVCQVDGSDTPNAAPTDNKITLSLSDTVTADIDDEGGYYDVLVVDSSGVDTYYLEGQVTFHNSVTVKA